MRTESKMLKQVSRSLRSTLLGIVICLSLACGVGRGAGPADRYTSLKHSGFLFHIYRIRYHAFYARYMAVPETYCLALKGTNRLLLLDATCCLYSGVIGLRHARPKP